MNRADKILELEFTVLEFYPDYVISRPREGEIFGGKQLADLVEVCSDNYAGRDFVYVSYRLNDFSVNPTVYLDLEKYENLVGFAVVSQKTSSLKMANFEKSFCKIPYEIFLDFEKAMAWVEKILKDKKADL